MYLVMDNDEATGRDAPRLARHADPQADRPRPASHTTRARPNGR
jgi:hypothetical protein